MRAFALLLFSAAAFAQNDAERGAKIFKQTCTVGYCHGANGGAGRAPVLAGRNLDSAYVAKVTRDGIAGTGMPAWKDRLSAGDLNAVIAYTLKINGGSAIFAPVPASELAAQAIPAAAAAGKALFFDPIRGTRCGTCHALESWGAAIGPNLTHSQPTLALMRNGKGGQAQSATIAGGAPFPALLVESKGGTARVYDLTTAPPVLRTIAAKQLRLGGKAQWKHADFVSTYSDSELNAIAEYLKWLAHQ